MRLIKKGQSILELMIVMALLAILLPVLLVGFTSSRSGKAQQQQRLQATALLKEAEEAVRTVRESGWNNIPANGNYYAQPSGSTWSLTPVSASGANINGLNELITIANAYRNDQVLVPSTTPGAIIDPSTKAVTITISWSTPFLSSINSTLYLTRLDNLSQPYTTKADFNQTGSIKSNTVIVDTLNTPINDDGQIDLGAGGGGGNWCDPKSDKQWSVNLDRQGIPTAVFAIQGSVVFGAGQTAALPAFSETAITGNPTPGQPAPTQFKGEYDISKVNGVYRDTDKYAYLASDASGEQIKILDLTQYSNPPTNDQFKKVGWFEDPAKKNGKSVFVLGNVGYMTNFSPSGNDKQFYTFDLNSRLGSRSQLNTNHNITLAGAGNQIVVVNHPDGKTYAYVATDSTTTQMQVIDVTDPTNPSIVRQVQTNNSRPGIDISINSTGTRVYLITSYAGSDKNDFFIIDTSTITGSGNLPIIGNGYNTNEVGGMNPKGVAAVTGNRVIIAGTGGSIQYLVLNIDQENDPKKCGPGLTISGGANDVAAVLQDDGYAYSYVVTGDTGAELQIILGGGGGQYSASGTYTSAPFEPGYKTAFNRFIATVNKPSQTNITVQVAVADETDCANASYTFVGPDKANPEGSFYTASDGTISGAIPYLTVSSYKNPGRCFRYKVIMNSTDSTQSPSLYDFTINYSP